MRTLIVTQHVRASAQAVPLAAGCITATLPTELRRQTEIVNLFPGENCEVLCQQLLAREPDVVAFSLALWNREPMLELARQLRSVRPEVFLIAGGPETAGNCRQLIAEGQLDGVIHGEGELAFSTLLQSLDKGRLTSGITGFISAAAPESTCAPAICPDLAALPSPWLTGQLPLQQGGGVLWEVARGCHFNCSFCYDAKGHQGVRPFPFERLRQELKLFVEAGIAQIWVLDSTFNAPAERGHKLLRLLIDSAPQIHYHIEAKADFLDPESIRLLAQLSCSVQIGLQSARPEILKPLQRHLNLKQTTQVLGRLNRAGIVFGLDLIYGLPGDDHAGFTHSLDFALNQQPNQVDIFPLAILPGTDLYQRQGAFAVCGMSSPPYLLEKNCSYPAVQLEQSRLLAAATDIFYNRGRAVGFLLQISEAVAKPPAKLLQTFLDWMISARALSQEHILDIESWTPEKILPLQREFCREQLRQRKSFRLIPLAEDLIHYHYLCAEMLLGEDCLPAADSAELLHLVEVRQWQRNPAIRIQFFHYDLSDLEAIGAEPLATIDAQLERDPGYGLFLRQEGQLVIETLDETFAQMLLSATAAQSGQALLDQLDSGEKGELITFAVEQGLLLPVT